MIRLLWLMLFCSIAGPVVALTDSFVLMNEASRQSHRLQMQNATWSDRGLVLMPLKEPQVNGGSCSFRMRVDPALSNYLTAEVSGDELSPNLLILFCEGKMIGYRHLGDYDILDHGCQEPMHRGATVQLTSLLPESLTRGKKEIDLEIRSYGPIWGYGATYEILQKKLTAPCRAIHGLTTHTDPFLPGSTGVTSLHERAPIRRDPGPEVIDAIRKRLHDQLLGMMNGKKPLPQDQLQLLGQGYHLSWTPVYQQAKVVQRIVEGVDACYRTYVADPKKEAELPWRGLGYAADAVRQVASQLMSQLDQEIDDGRGKMVKRRDAWAAMWVHSRDFHCRNRRQYTNQSMINDLLGIYLCNRALALIKPEQAMKENAARRYLYESVSLEPWRGNDGEHGPEKPLGENFWQLTKRGLTRELGYVGYYGEILDWAAQIDQATAEPGKPHTGDSKIREQLIKMTKARAYFRWPSTDSLGNRAFRIETAIGWRDSDYPGAVCYAQRSSIESSPLGVAGLTLDPHAIGSVQQMMEDGQLFASLAALLPDRRIATTLTLLHVPTQWEAVRQAPPSAHRLPMHPSQPDFVFADEENGVIALKHKGEMLYASLYWRSRESINQLSRVHHITPSTMRVATLRVKSTFDDSGHVYQRKNWTVFGFANGGPHDPAKPQSAHTGEKQPIALHPPGIDFTPGKETPFAGKASTYELSYGPYHIVMNCHPSKSHSAVIPEAFQRSTRMDTREAFSGKEITLPAGTTVVLSNR